MYRRDAATATQDMEYGMWQIMNHSDGDPATALLHAGFQPFGTVGPTIASCLFFRRCSIIDDATYKYILSQHCPCKRDHCSMNSRRFTGASSATPPTLIVRCFDRKVQPGGTNSSWEQQQPVGLQQQS
jgi:hypothetical protein